MTGRWASSTRRTELPPDWRSRIRPAVLNRDGHRCTWLDGHLDGGFVDYLRGNYDPAARCTRRARDVDHALGRHDHRVEACRSLCISHHRQRTGREAAEGRARKRGQLPVRKHPGLL